MAFIKLRMTCSHKAEQMIFELFTGLLNHALTEFRVHAFEVSLLSPDWNFIPGPVMQFSIVAASKCFVRFLAKRDLTLSDHCLQSEEHCRALGKGGCHSSNARTRSAMPGPADRICTPMGKSGS